MKKQTFLLLGSVLIPLLLAAGDLTLKPIHPYESVAETLQQRFSLPNALSAMASIQGWLESFRRLTKATKGRIAPAAWKEIGNTEWDIQVLGFANLPKAVEGALRYQDWQLKKAHHQLALVEEQAGRGAPGGSAQARLELSRSEKDFQAFWDSLAIAD